VRKESDPAPREDASAPESADDAAGTAVGGDASEAPDGAPAGDARAEEPGSEEERRRSRAAEERPTPPPPERLDGAIEALLLASGETLSDERLRDLLGLPSVVHVRESVVRLRERWASAGTAVEIQDVAGGHRVATRPEYAEYVRRLFRKPAADRLSPSLLETLSIVAYKQPVARAEVERIRGVQCGEALRGLLDRRLVKVAGRSDQPGRPLLYATTTRFLEVFGLARLEDLPDSKDLQRM
jgi:segregation and condensation protein B